MVFRKMFKPRPAETAGRALYAVAVAQARRPAFYTLLGADDTPPGRYEIYTLHVVLLLRRLKGEGEQAAETGQALFDAYIAGLDIALRELGTGDLSMAKKMKALGRAFYGRVKAYEDAFAALPDEAPLRDLFARTVGDGSQLFAYAMAAEACLAGQGIQTLLTGEATFPEPAA
jgi:cytochrome b pre-mRNA-processing protein 3